MKLNATDSAAKQVHNPNRIIRLSEVLHKTGLSRSTMYRLIQLDQFPKQVSLLSKTSGWSEREVDQWIEDRLSSRESV